MRRVLTMAGTLAAFTSAASAGGIDRSGQSIGALFEEGRYLEFSVGSVSPSVSGVGTAFSPTAGGASGDMAPSYLQVGAAYKADISDSLSYALIYDQPFGADVDYPLAPYFATGSSAELRTHALTGLLRYKFPSNFSVYAGLRYQTLEALATVTLVPGYSVVGERDGGVGYVLGASYERPDIAMRVALTYNSSIDHSVTTTETGPVAGATTTETSTPQSVNLDFQTGIAADTLLFGSIRWVEWSKFDLSPFGYMTATGGSLVSYDNNTLSYSLGIGRRFNENWSGAVTIGYEKSNGGFASNLGPTDGNISLGVGVTYTQDNWKIQGGVRYVNIGDAQTTLGGGVAASDFTSNHAVGVGIKVSTTF